MYQIVLASGSPRRREILNQVGISHTVLVSRAEEVKREGETPVSLPKNSADQVPFKSHIKLPTVPFP